MVELSEDCFWDRCMDCCWAGCNCKCHRDQEYDWFESVWIDREEDD